MEHQIASVQEKRRKLLALHYEDKIGADLFSEQEAALRERLEVLKAESGQVARESPKTDLEERFGAVERILADMDIDRLWAAATEEERRVLVQELVQEVRVFPDHLEVTVEGAPKLNVTLEEVGLKGPQLHSYGVGGGI